MSARTLSKPSFSTRAARPARERELVSVCIYTYDIHGTRGVGGGEQVDGEIAMLTDRRCTRNVGLCAILLSGFICTRAHLRCTLIIPRGVPF